MSFHVVRTLAALKIAVFGLGYPTTSFGKVRLSFHANEAPKYMKQMCNTESSEMNRIQFRLSNSVGKVQPIFCTIHGAGNFDVESTSTFRLRKSVDIFFRRLFFNVISVQLSWHLSSCVALEIFCNLRANCKHENLELKGHSFGNHLILYCKTN